MSLSIPQEMEISPLNFKNAGLVLQENTLFLQMKTHAKNALGVMRYILLLEVESTFCLRINLCSDLISSSALIQSYVLIITEELIQINI
jgi:hypothetical protein